MDRFIIEGGKTLKGSLKASGSKNASLPIMASSLMAEGETVLHNCPDVVDVRYMMKVLSYLGADVSMKRNTLRIKVPRKIKNTAPYDLVRKMRASYYVLGALIGKQKNAVLSLPGGCAIGERPIDLHIKGFKALGCNVVLRHGYVYVKCKKLKANEIYLEGKFGTSMGATINVLMAAVFAKGKTIIKGAALEPEIADVAAFLNRMGADIKGLNTPILEINGIDELQPTEYTILSDRIESGTLLAAASITGGELTLSNTNPEQYSEVLNKFTEIGDSVQIDGNTVHIKGSKHKKSIEIDIMPYPFFPTDMQAQFMSILVKANGISTITENVFTKRFMHIPELKRMGADIELRDNTAIIKGVKKLSGAPVMASDLRASAALVLAGLVADGETEVKRIYHIDRGYEHIEKKLRKIGAHIRRYKK